MASPSILPSLAAVYYPSSSTFDELDRDDLRYTYGVEDDAQVIIPTGIHQFFNPPAGSSTFFKEQFVAGLRLPIHPFFSDICRYFRIPLGQLTPNSIRILYGFVVICDRRRHRAPRPVPDSGPSSIPSPPPAAAASPPPPIVTPPPIPSQVNDPPTSSDIQVEPPLAQPSTSQEPQGDEAGPSERPSVTPPVAPSQGPSSAPSGSTAEPSAPLGSAAGPSEPPPITHHCYCTTVPSKERLWSRADVPTSSLKIKGRLATLWEESIQHMDFLPPLAQMDKFVELYIKNKVLRDQVAELELQLNDPAQASHALRAEIKDLTKKKNSLEVSLALANHELKDLREKQSRVDIVHQQSINQQALKHQRAMEQLAQKLRAAETLARNKIRS
ncbi:formin-1-like [Zingiber officinale]|uniref:formin-1-like n=1 Tax=Zingiber officinale TaxID=94328 RepID=UPI001C4AE169|nr:formin-1-like [Zingiber officinale]